MLCQINEKRRSGQKSVAPFLGALGMALLKRYEWPGLENKEKLILAELEWVNTESR
jgi:hypothetical protein